MKEIIDFLNDNASKIEMMDFGHDSVQQIVDFGLDTKNKLSQLDLSPGNDFMQSIDLFQSLLDEEFKADDEKFFNDSKEDLLTDISLLTSHLKNVK